MDNSSNSGSSHSNNTQTQNGNRNQRSRQQVDRELPFKDLRELLNHKRQNADGKTGGPPSDPKYNYLSDPMRDGESSSSTNSNNIGTNNIGTGRFTNQRNFRNSPTNFSTGRGRGNYNPDYHQKPGYSNEPSRFPREWDQGKEDPRNRRYNTSYKNPQQSQHSEGPSNYKQNDTTYFRQRYQDPRPINTNYKGPPHKYNPNYRGGNHQRFPPRSPRRHQHPDPINISVEYNVEDGFRRCTALDVKLDKTWKRGQNRKIVQQQQQQPPPEDEGEEENWDEDAADTRIGGAILETVANEQTEAEDVVEETPEVVEPRKNDGAAVKDRKIGGATKQTEFIEKKPLKVEREPKKKDPTTTRISGVNENTPKNRKNERKDVAGGKNEGLPKPPKVAAASTDTNIDRNNEQTEQVVEKKTPKVVEEPKDAAATKAGGAIEETPENQQNERKDIVTGSSETLNVEGEPIELKIDGEVKETPKNQQNQQNNIVEGKNEGSPETSKVEGEPNIENIGGEVEETPKIQQNEQNNIVKGKNEGSPENSKLEREHIELKIGEAIEETTKTNPDIVGDTPKPGVVKDTPNPPQVKEDGN